MDGKTLIHPSQVAPCNEIFSPTEEEVAWSRKIIAAFEEPANALKGVITLEGRMVERLHLRHGPAHRGHRRRYRGHAARPRRSGSDGAWRPVRGGEKPVDRGTPFRTNRHARRHAQAPAHKDQTAP